MDQKVFQGKGGGSIKFGLIDSILKLKNAHFVFLAFNRARIAPYTLRHQDFYFFKMCLIIVIDPGNGREYI